MYINYYVYLFVQIIIGNSIKACFVFIDFFSKEVDCIWWLCDRNGHRTHTLRATELKELYETITMKGLEKDERLDALLTLKTTVRVWNGPHVIIIL